MRILDRLDHHPYQFAIASFLLITVGVGALFIWGIGWLFGWLVLIGSIYLISHAMIATLPSGILNKVEDNCIRWDESRIRPPHSNRSRCIAEGSSRGRTGIVGGGLSVDGDDVSRQPNSTCFHGTTRSRLGRFAYIAGQTGRIGLHP